MIDANDEIKMAKPREIAAIDLGSNSFHMVVARVVEQSIQIVSKHKRRVRLAAGLNEQQFLDDAAIERGIDCLAMFAERLQGFKNKNVKVAATFTLRDAKNSHVFLQKAREVFPYPIEVISGAEEARLIYLGVSHTQAEEGQKLVVDIGGGSTELIIGQQFQIYAANSKPIGCINLGAQFFPDGQFTLKGFVQAQLATELKLKNLAKEYIKLDWKQTVGCSGTIKSIRDVLIAHGYDDGIITKKRLDNLIDEISKIKEGNTLNLAGLSNDRQPVFAAGIAILCGVFQALNIEKMIFSDAALREGLLYEMENKYHNQHYDVRTRTANSLAERYHIDLIYANRVQQSAAYFYQQAEPQMSAKKTELAGLLNWAALLHEIGLSIAHTSFHKHSAYILQHTDLPGFNQEQQTVLAILTRFHRKALKLADMPDLTLFKSKHIYVLIRALRLACVLNVQRSDTPLDKIILTVDELCWSLAFPKGWLEKNRLLNANLQVEQDYWQTVGWVLEIKESSVIDDLVF